MSSAATEPDLDQATYPFTLGFTVDDCDSCGTQQSVEAPCHACGAGDVADEGPCRDRAAGAAAATAALNAAFEPADAVRATEPDAWFPILGDWVTAFMTALRDYPDDPGHPEALVAVAASLGQIEADLAAAPRYRPALAGWRSVDGCAHHCRLLTEAYLACLAAPTMDEAGRHGDTAQRSLDTIGPYVEEWTDLQDGWFSDDDTLPSDVIARGTILGARTIGAASSGLLDADTSGHGRYEQVTGSATCPPGLGLGIGMVDAQVSATMDVDRFWNGAALTYRRLTGPQSRGRRAFARVIATPEWMADMIDVQVQLVDAVRETPTEADPAEVRRIARGLVRLGHLNGERAAKYLMATVLAAFRDRDYSELRRKDFGALLSEMRDVGLDRLLLGIDAALRHGDAHGEFTVNPDGVAFTCDRREYDFLGWDQLLDRVLAGIESSLALYTAVLCASAEAGIDVDDFVDVTAMFAPEDLMGFVLAVDGWTDTEIHIADGEARVTGTIPRPVKFAIIGVLGNHVPDGVERLSVHAHTPGGPTVYEGPTAPMAAYTAHERGPAKDAAFLDVIASWTVDGAVIADRDAVRKVVAYRVLEAAFDDGVEMIRRTKGIRPWLDAARRAGDDELAAAAAQVLAAVRQLGMGQPMGPGAESAELKLRRWKAADLAWGLSEAS